MEPDIEDNIMICPAHATCPKAGLVRDHCKPHHRKEKCKLNCNIEFGGPCVLATPEDIVVHRLQGGHIT